MNMLIALAGRIMSQLLVARKVIYFHIFSELMKYHNQYYDHLSN